MCLTHFVADCYEKLDRLSRETGSWSYGGLEWEQAKQITKECAQGAADYSQCSLELTNLERARLLDISLWAAELGRRLRRCPRQPLKIPVRLISDLPGRPWTEEAETIDVGRDGAQIACEHAVEIGDLLKVHRLDNGEQFDVHVIWRRRTATGLHEIGFEVVGRKVFWSS
jgi:hypothetical protein